MREALLPASIWRDRLPNHIECDSSLSETTGDEKWIYFQYPKHKKSRIVTGKDKRTIPANH